MNTITLIGRLTRNPEIRFSGDTTIARYTLAVDREVKGKDGKDADFINCMAFNKKAEFIEKHLTQGRKIAVKGRLQTDSYKNKDGVTIPTADVIVESHYFCDSKPSTTNAAEEQKDDDFVTIPIGVDDDGLPF